MIRTGRDVVALLFFLSSWLGAQPRPEDGMIPAPEMETALPARPGRAPSGGDGAAGTPLRGPTAIPGDTLLWGVQWDAPTGRLWVASQRSGAPSLHSIDGRTLAHLGSYDVTNLPTPGNPSTALMAGSLNDLARTRDGTLLATDYNGDVSRFDDSIVELAFGGGAPQLRNVWYLDSADCPMTCRPNGNRDVPQARIHRVVGIEAIETSTSDPGSAQLILVSSGNWQAPSAASVHVVELAPGLPGSWTRRSSRPSPTGGPLHTLDFDSALQCFWAADGGWVYEMGFDFGLQALSVRQAFPAQLPRPASGIVPVGVSGMEGTVGPHRLAYVQGSAGPAVPNEIWLLDSGHHGPSDLVDVIFAPSALGLVLQDDETSAGHAYLGLLSFTGDPAAWIPIDSERSLALNPDPLFSFILASRGGSPFLTNLWGVFDGQGRTTVWLQEVPPLAGVPLKFRLGYVVPSQPPSAALHGLKTVSPVIAGSKKGGGSKKMWCNLIPLGSGNKPGGEVEVKLKAKKNDASLIDWAVVITDDPEVIRNRSHADEVGGALPAGGGEHSIQVTIGDKLENHQGVQKVKVSVTFTSRNGTTDTVETSLKKE